mmetsp:Transcript_52949/g.121554  ORF Transcript_52949/g.121554 Transcript_52949/m.121554 type:complete len:204 (-) Transcript_52949:137-748(-)
MSGLCGLPIWTCRQDGQRRAPGSCWRRESAMSWPPRSGGALAAAESVPRPSSNWIGSSLAARHPGVVRGWRSPRHRLATHAGVGQCPSVASPCFNASCAIATQHPPQYWTSQHGRARASPWAIQEFCKHTPHTKCIFCVLVSIMCTSTLRGPSIPSFAARLAALSYGVFPLRCWIARSICTRPTCRAAWGEHRATFPCTLAER